MDTKTLDSIKELGNLEDSIHKNLSQTTDGKKKEIIYGQLNTLSKVRNTLYDGVRNIYGVSNKKAHKRRVARQNKALTGVINNTLEDTNSEINSLNTSLHNTQRLAEINTYKRKQYEAYIEMLFYILYAFVVMLTLIFLTKRRLLNMNIARILGILTTVVCVLMLMYLVNDMQQRNNMDYDKYDWPNMKSDGGKNLDYVPEPEPEPVPSPVGGELNDGTNCIGEKCCGVGTSYDNVSNMCTYSTSIDSTSIDKNNNETDDEMDDEVNFEPFSEPNTCSSV